MVAKRIIPCLDVKDNMVVKGTQFKTHKIVGDIIELAEKYNNFADELVFYDITASSDVRSVDVNWIKSVAHYLDIPFCVSGGIRSKKIAECILNAGADKISINSPALENPDLINELVMEFGQQCVVIGIDSLNMNNDYYVCQYTGDSKKMQISSYKTKDWIAEVQMRGAGEIVLNCMNQDGMRSGYDITQLNYVRDITKIPLIASGGAGSINDFINVFKDANVDGALAASVFHTNTIDIQTLKIKLNNNGIEVRLC